MHRKKFTWALLLFFGMVLSSFAQQAQGYTIVKPGGYTVKQLTDALDQAKLDPYRKQNKATYLYFENGAEVRLLSGVELQVAGIPHNAAVFIPDNHPMSQDRKFSILSNGMLAVFYPTKIK